jgi:hypothetical protein
VIKTRQVTLSAFWCGAFRNPPETVARIYKSLRRCEIIFLWLLSPYSTPVMGQTTSQYPQESCGSGKQIRKSAAFAIVKDAATLRVLVVRASCGSQDGTWKWMLPGGEVDAGQSPFEAACRELEDGIPPAVRAAFLHWRPRWPS